MKELVREESRERKRRDELFLDYIKQEGKLLVPFVMSFEVH